MANMEVMGVVGRWQWTSWFEAGLIVKRDPVAARLWLSKSLGGWLEFMVWKKQLKAWRELENCFGALGKQQNFFLTLQETSKVL